MRINGQEDLKMREKTRTEEDSLGKIEVPADAYWGATTQRAINNFQISNQRIPSEFIVSLAKVKRACLVANADAGALSEDLSEAVMQAIEEILREGKHLNQFPVDVYQTGSGTQTNMNMNEVLANRANELLGHKLGKKSPVHPNDHVNMGQSSNDVIPTAMHLTAIEAIRSELVPTVDELLETLDQKIEDFKDIVKVGRTHLQDAVPIPLSTEFKVYRRQVESSLIQIQKAADELMELPIGGTAVGTGLNSRDGFAEEVVKELSKMTGLPLRSNPLKAESIASHSKIVGLSSALRSLALAALKMANDIRWMGTGPRAGLSELKIPANEPGSSIMPGKVNPTQAEALIQVCIRVLGNDATIAQAEAYGSVLDLNVTKPLMVVTILDSIHILAGGLGSFAANLLEDLEPNVEHIREQLNESLMIVTRLSPVVGYDKASEIAKQAFQSGKTIRETVEDMALDIEGLDDLLDPKKMV